MPSRVGGGSATRRAAAERLSARGEGAQRLRAENVGGAGRAAACVDAGGPYAAEGFQANAPSAHHNADRGRRPFHLLVVPAAEAVGRPEDEPLLGGCLLASRCAPSGVRLVAMQRCTIPLDDVARILSSTAAGAVTWRSVCSFASVCAGMPASSALSRALTRRCAQRIIALADAACRADALPANFSPR